MKDATRTKTTREAILEATDRLLARYGYKKMTIDDLAQEVGIGKGSVYLHFSSKEEIAMSHIDGLIDKMLHNLSAIAASNSPASDRVLDFLLERVLYRFDRVQHYKQSLDELLAVLRPTLLERRRNYFKQEARILGDIIADGQKKGEFEAGDAVDLAYTCISATNSLLPYSMSTIELGDRSQLEDRVRKTADLLIRGLRP
jgi:AcrR family transcriptional regulator